MKYKYPNTITEGIYEKYRKDKAERIIAFFDYVVTRIHSSGKRWVEIPSNTLRDYLGAINTSGVIKSLNQWVISDKSYNVHTHKCKSFTLTDEFINELAKFNNVGTLLKFIESVGTNSKNNNNQSINSNSIEFNSNNYSSILLHTYSSILCPTSFYTIDTNKLTKAYEQILEEYKNDEKEEYYIECSKQNIKIQLERILQGNIKTTVSDKNGRHYDNITNLQKEIRMCLLKHTEAYLGQLDLKCCHGFIVLGLMKDKLTTAEYKKVYDLLAKIDLWNVLAAECNYPDKETTKSKFQLFMNGSERDNQSNKVYTYFKSEHGAFTKFLFKLKDGLNLNNEVNRIESSIMHSEGLKTYLQTLNLNCDIIHDCLWLYGKGDKNIILSTAQQILRDFKRKYNIDMVFTLELVGKNKELISA